MSSSVIDPLILAHGLLADGGPSRRIVDALRLKRFRGITSPALIDYALALLSHSAIRKTYGLADRELEDIGMVLHEMLWVQDVSGELLITRHDALANALASAAVACHAQSIVTDNLALTTQGHVRGIAVVEPGPFLNSLAHSDLPE